MANAPKRPFHTASEADIKRGEVSDVYFARTVQILIHRGDRKRVKAEVYLKSLPEDWRWGILAGLEEAAALLEGDRKSTRLNSSHGYISYAVFCLKKKKKRK